MYSLSIIIPVYYSEGTILPLVDKLVSSVENLTEIVLVNDGSTDGTHESCLALCNRYSKIVKYAQLGRNFGEHNAVMAGLKMSTGDYAVIMDDDFQNPPETVQNLVDTILAEDCDVVYSYYDKKEHNFFRNLGSRFNDIVANKLLKKPKGLYLSSYKCMNRFLIDEVVKYEGPYPYIDGLILRSTQHIKTCLVDHHSRDVGESGYTLSKLVRLWLNMCLNFSILPLRLCTYLGSFLSCMGLLFACYVVYEKLSQPDIPVGWSSAIVIFMFFSGVQLIMLGVLGEYLGSLFLASNKTPQYVIRERKE